MNIENPIKEGRETQDLSMNALAWLAGVPQSRIERIITRKELSN